eukprot:393272-Pleurochrysis_carterae.AAC.1
MYGGAAGTAGVHVNVLFSRVGSGAWGRERHDCVLMKAIRRACVTGPHVESSACLNSKKATKMM